MITRVSMAGLLVLGVIFLTPASAWAQAAPIVDGETKIQDIEGLRLNLIQQTQDPGSKQLDFDLVMMSAINSDRVVVSWSVSGSSEIVAGEKAMTMKVQSGGVYSSSITILPRVRGITTIRVTVEAFQIDGTRIATASKTIGSSIDGEVIPNTSDHSLAKSLYLARNITMAVTGILIAVGVVIFGGAYFWRWLNNRNA